MRLRLALGPPQQDAYMVVGIMFDAGRRVAKRAAERREGGRAAYITCRADDVEQYGAFAGGLTGIMASMTACLDNNTEKIRRCMESDPTDDGLTADWQVGVGCA